MSDHPETPDRAEPFRQMADKIAANADNGFAGAFVIVAPDGGVHDMLVLDRSANAVIFWSAMKTRVDIALAEIDDTQRRSGYR